MMGTFGIGVSRIAAAAIEQNHDEFGIKWPLALAPYPVVLLPVAPKDPAALAMAEAVYAELLAAGVDALLDDREERAGVKFKDADLIGFPLRLTFGKSVAENLIELKHRSTGQVEMVPRGEVVAKIKNLVQAG